MNKKPTILAVASLGSLALIGTGFAGWVISTSATASADGGITAYVVADERIRVENASWDEVPDNEVPATTQIRFGKPANHTADADNDWLLANSVEGVERLHAVYTIDLWSSAQALPSITANTYSVAESSAPSKYGAALTGGYVTGPAITETPAVLPGVDISGMTTDQIDTAVTELHSKVYYTIAGRETTSDPVGKNFQIKVHFVFGWGATIENVNPYFFFNGNEDLGIERKDPSVRPNATTNPSDQRTWGDLALEALTAIRDANGASFAFTMKISPNSGN